MGPLNDPTHRRGQLYRNIIFILSLDKNMFRKFYLADGYGVQRKWSVVQSSVASGILHSQTPCRRRCSYGPLLPSCLPSKNSPGATWAQHRAECWVIRMNMIQSQLRGPSSKSKHLLRECDGKTFNRVSQKALKEHRWKRDIGVGRRVLRMRFRAARTLLRNSVWQQALGGGVPCVVT